MRMNMLGAFDTVIGATLWHEDLFVCEYGTKYAMGATVTNLATY